jgi:hypothetical protein
VPTDGADRIEPRRISSDTRAAGDAMCRPNEDPALNATSDVLGIRSEPWTAWNGWTRVDDIGVTGCCGNAVTVEVTRAANEIAFVGSVYFVNTCS